MTETTMTEMLDREFLTIRGRFLDLAAAIDRFDRAEGDVADDPRWHQIQQVIEILASPNGHRAERAQLALSLNYSEDWRRIYGV